MKRIKDQRKKKSNDILLNYIFIIDIKNSLTSRYQISRANQTHKRTNNYQEERETKNKKEKMCYLQ